MFHGKSLVTGGEGILNKSFNFTSIDDGIKKNV